MSRRKQTSCLGEVTNVLNPEARENFLLFLMIKRIQGLPHHSGIKYIHEFNGAAFLITSIFMFSLLANTIQLRL
jgi:hypothetical protein